MPLLSEAVPAPGPAGPVCKVGLALTYELDMTIDPCLIGQPASLQDILALSDFAAQEKQATFDVSTSA